MLIGFRPEHIELANGQESSAVRFPAKVDVVEYLGNEELIHAQAEGNEIVALLPSDRKVCVGDNVSSPYRWRSSTSSIPSRRRRLPAERRL